MTLLQGYRICSQKICTNKFWKIKIFPCIAGLLLTFVNWVSLERCSNLWNYLGSFSSSSCFTTINQVKIFAHWSFDLLSFTTINTIANWWSGFSESIQDWSISSLKRQIFFVKSWFLICFLSVDWLLENLIQTKVCKLETFRRKGKLFVSSRRCASWTRTTRSARRRRRSCGSTTSQVSSSTSAPTPRWRAR